jgi:transcriptional regulator with XRE-family HTH domain
VSSAEILCTNIRRLRLVRGWSQETVAERAGLSTRHFQDIEAQRREGIRLATVDRIASVLEVPAWHLFDPERFPEPERQRGKSATKIRR